MGSVEGYASVQFYKFTFTTERATRLQDFEEIGSKVLPFQLQRIEKSENEGRSAVVD